MVYAAAADLDALVTADSAELVELASNTVDTFLRVPLPEAVRVETFDLRSPEFSPDRMRLWLVPANWPLTVTGIVEDAVTLTGDDFTVHGDGSLVREGRRWGDEVTATYTTGFAAGSDELQLARRIVLQLASMAAANPHGLSSIGMDGVTPSFVVSESGEVLPPLTLSRAQKDELRHLRWRRRVA